MVVPSVIVAVVFYAIGGWPWLSGSLHAYRSSACMPPAGELRDAHVGLAAL